MMKLQVAAALAAACAQASIKVGVIADLHMDLNYSSTASVKDKCRGNGLNKSSDEAPIARIGCDPSSTLVDYMLQRFSEKFGEVDVIVVNGDHVAHKVAPHHDVAQESDWEAVKANLQASAQIIEKHFPNTLVLTNIGNNDGYHSQAPDTDQKDGYYGFLYNLWVTQYPGNARLATDEVKATFMDSGCYRADVTDTLSVLSFNNEYMDNDDDTSFQKNEAMEQLDWLEAQLATAYSSGRKFILSGHVYAGARYHGGQMWHSEFASRYFQIIRDYHDAIVIEVMAHDHFGDLRYHSSDNVLDLPDQDPQFDFHNLFVAPGVTPNKGNNPGVAMFEVSDDGTPFNLQMEFIDLLPQVGKSSVSYSDLQFLSLPMSDYGLTTLTASDLSAFRKRIEADQDMALEYLTRKMGFDANSESETQVALDIYKDKDLISAKKLKTGEFVCEMNKSLSAEEFEACCDAANTLEMLTAENMEVMASVFNLDHSSDKTDTPKLVVEQLLQFTQ